MTKEMFEKMFLNSLFCLFVLTENISFTCCNILFTSSVSSLERVELR